MEDRGRKINVSRGDDITWQKKWAALTRNLTTIGTGKKRGLRMRERDFTKKNKTEGTEEKNFGRRISQVGEWR